MRSTEHLPTPPRTRRRPRTQVLNSVRAPGDTALAATGDFLRLLFYRRSGGGKDPLAPVPRRRRPHRPTTRVVPTHGAGGGRGHCGEPSTVGGRTAPSRGARLDRPSTSLPDEALHHDIHRFGHSLGEQDRHHPEDEDYGGVSERVEGGQPHRPTRRRLGAGSFEMNGASRCDDMTPLF